MKIDKKMLGIIAAAAVLIILVIIICAVKGKPGGESEENIYPSGMASKAEYAAEPAKKEELKLADTTLTKMGRKMGRSWYTFDANADITSESYNFLPDGTYTHQYKYSLEAGGKFIYDKGFYSVPEKGTLILYPDGEGGVIYDYKVENDALTIRKKGTEEWSKPFTMSDN